MADDDYSPTILDLQRAADARGEDGPLDKLRDRVSKFHALELPGQPMGMHMGTSYLVSDLMRAVEELSKPSSVSVASEKSG